MTDHVEYAELHAHSAFSFLDGASQPEEMVSQAARLGLSALALTDHNGFYGVVRMASAARELGLRSIFGTEMSFAVPEGPGGRLVLDAATGTPDARASHLVVLARSPAGYARLSRAVAMGHLATHEKGLVHYVLEDLAAIGEGELLVLTGCRKGSVRRALAGIGVPGHGVPLGQVSTASFAAASQEVDKLAALFGRDNVAVEMTDTGSPLDSEIHAALADIARESRLPLVATTNAHYATERDADLAGALAAIRARSSLDDMDGWLPGSPGQHLRSGAEMRWRHRRHPQAVTTAAKLGEECAFDLSLVAPRLPPYPVPDGYTEASWLRHLTYQGAVRRYGSRENERVAGAWAQIDRELDVIETLEFPGYFLIVHDIVDFCRSQDILCQGRGSAANSAVCYALGVTAVDAVSHGLLFERFLAAERDGPPDIDVDIESERREEVIQHVYLKHGRINAAMVANVIQYRPRSAVRDAARALGHDAGQQDAWSTSIDRWGSLRPRRSEEPEWHTRHRDALWSPPAPEPMPAQSNPALDGIPVAVVDLAERLQRLPRHLGIHPGGMVLCDRPVIDVCPVEWGRMPGRTVLQWDKDDCAEVGLVKFDLLGLGMLSALKHAFHAIRDSREQVAGQNLMGAESPYETPHREEELGLHTLPHEDPGVYDLLCAADTVGVFQVESRAQMATLPRLRPRTFYDIVVEVALIRPGPIQGGSVHPYINRARKREPVTYPHHLLEKSLSRTLGVPLFQEQLMQMAMDCAGFDGVLADQLRRAMGSKRSPERMEALRARFMVGAHDKGVPPETAQQIFDKLKAFADFGFPESHAYSFAHLVYASAWLKVRHPAAFYAGLLAAQPMGFYSPQSLAADARRHGQAVLRPCVTHSEVLARVQRLDEPYAPLEQTRLDLAALVDVDRHLAVRMGLMAVRGLGKEAAQAIVAARQESPFTSLADMARRVRVRPRGARGETTEANELQRGKGRTWAARSLTQKQWEALATAGALESLGVTRREALWASGALAGEGPDALPGVSPGLIPPLLPAMTAEEEAVADVWAHGVSVDSYPTVFVREGLDRAGVLRVEQVFTHEPQRRVQVAGVVTHRQRPATARGVTFLSLEDETGIVNVVCSPEVWRRHQAVARRSPALVIRGMIEQADGATNLVAEHLAPLSIKVPTKSRDFR